MKAPTEYRCFRRRRGAASSSGFTLIEIMLALAILGTGLLVLLEAHYATLRLFDQTQQAVVVGELFEKAIGESEIELLAGNLSGSGEFNKRYPDFKYSYEATLIGDDERMPFYQLTVKLTGPDVERQISLIIYDTQI